MSEQLVKPLVPVLGADLGSCQEFELTRNGPSVNEATKARAVKGRNYEIDGETGVGTIARQSGFKIEIMDSYDVDIPMSAVFGMTLDMLVMLEVASNHGERRSTLTLDRYMTLRGLNNARAAKRQLESAANMLFHAYAYNEEKTKNGKLLKYEKMRILDYLKVSRSGDIEFSFSREFYMLTSGYNMMFLPEVIFKHNINSNPNAYFLARKLCEYKNMNLGKSNENIISVKSLLKVCDSIPPKDSVKNRNYTSRIIEPFNDDMDANSAIFDWEYCHKGGAPLTDEELENFTYDLFRTLFVKINWRITFPDEEERRQEIKSCRKNAGRRKAYHEKKNVDNGSSVE